MRYWLDEEEGVVKPEIFAKNLNANFALITFSNGFYDCFADFAEGEAPQFPGAISGIRIKEAVVYKSYFGAPAAGMLIECLIASSTKNIIMLGEAGSISPAIRIGDVFIPTWGVREEGTSFHYLPPDITPKPSEVLTQQLLDCLADFNPKIGGIWSTDAPFKETLRKVKKYSEYGVKAVDMETTALMSIAMHRGINFAAVLLITDELWSGKWVEEFLGENIKAMREKITKKIMEKFVYV